MTVRRPGPASSGRPPIRISKRLVAHVPDRTAELHYGPPDGEPVAVPAPCPRLIAGYWCSCGSGFASLQSAEQVPRARVEIDPAADWCGFVDTAGDFIEPGARWPPERDRRDLQDVVEGLPVGTVVERFGPGIAPAFDRPWPTGYAGRSLREPETR